MSDVGERKVSGPPPRARKPEQGRSRLVKANRDAAQAAEQEMAPAPAVVSEASAATAATPEAQSLPPAPAQEPGTDAVVAAPSESLSVPAPASPTPPAAADPNKLVNATYRVPADLKKRLNSAISAVKTFEGWTSAEEYVQDLFERDIKRIQDEYNNGEPFPLRTKAMPRGRSIPPKDQ